MYIQNSLPTTCIWMWHYSYECDLFHMNVTWRKWIWHDSYEFDMTHMNVTWRAWMCVTWLIWMWHDSWLLVLHTLRLKIRRWVFHISTSWQMSHDTYACDMTYQEWVMTHVNVIWRIINELWHTWMWYDFYPWVMTQMNVKCLMNESWHT